MIRKKDTLTEWMEESAAVRVKLLAGGGKPGLALPERIAGKTGMEIMQAILAGELPYSHIAETLDFALIAVEPGKATFQGTPQLKHYNSLGTMHCGWYATLLDSAVGCAVHTLMPAGAGLHHGGTEHQHRACSLARNRSAGRHRHGHPLRQTTGHGRGPHRRAGWQAVCACNDDLLVFELPGG